TVGLGTVRVKVDGLLGLLHRQVRLPRLGRDACPGHIRQRELRVHVDRLGGGLLGLTEQLGIVRGVVLRKVGAAQPSLRHGGLRVLIEYLLEAFYGVSDVGILVGVLQQGVGFRIRVVGVIGVIAGSVRSCRSRN